MIKNILFDMDMTLLDFHKAEARALSNTLQSLGVEPTDEIVALYSKINLSQWKLLEKGEITRDELRSRRFELFLDAVGIKADAGAVAQSYEENLADGADYLDGAKELLEVLKGQYRMFIVSNGTSWIQHSRIKKAELAPYFMSIYISEELGYNKPDVRFFDACFADIAKSGFPIVKEETVIIGDSLTSDMQGGSNAGVTTVWFNPKGELATDLIPDYEIRHLDEIPDLLLDIS